MKIFLIDQNDRKCIKIAKLDRDFHKFLALLGLTTQHYGHRHRSKMLTKRALPASVARARRRPTRPGMGAARAKSQRDRPLRALNRGTGAPGVGDVSTPSNSNRKRRRTQEEVHGAVRTRPASGRLMAALKTPRVMTTRALPSPCKPALATTERGSRQLTDEERTQLATAARFAHYWYVAVQVERDVKEVALSVLANEARMARSDEKIRKVKVTELFMETETCRAGLLAASTFKVRVHRLKQNRDVQREALALVTEECGSSSQLSDETAYDENKVVRTRAAERRQNPQLLFEQVVREVSRSVITAAEGVGAMREVGVRVTQNFVKSAMRALSFGDAIPRLSEC